MNGRPLLLLLSVLSGCVGVPTRPPQHFLEPMDVANVPKDTSLLFEADVATHLFLVDGLRDAYDYVSQDDIHANAATAWRVILSPNFIIRQMHDSSAAVRTPSFMPRLSVEVLRVSRLGTPVANPDIHFAGARLLGFRASLQHHSNGQAGCFRTGFVPVDEHSNKCQWDQKTDTNSVALNRANGDFSSTFFEALAYGWWMTRGVSQISTLGGGIALGFDWYPDWLFGALTPEQSALYGKWRARAEGQGSWRPQAGIACHDPGNYRLLCVFAGELILDLNYVRAPIMTTDLARRLDDRLFPFRWSVEASYSLDGLLGSGPFIRWVDGQDYYNIGFVKRRKEFMAGVTFAPGGPDRIAKKSQLP
jgi:hypothetical protein